MQKWVSMLKNLPQDREGLNSFLMGGKDFSSFLAADYGKLEESLRRELERNLATRKGTKFLDLLQAQTDAVIRLWAVELANFLPAELRIPRLLAGMGDKDEEIKLLAARSLGQMKSSGVARQLIAGLSTDRWLPARIAEALSSMGQASLPFLAELASNPEDRLRLNAVEILEQINTPAAREIVLQLLYDASPQVRRKAAGVLLSFSDLAYGPEALKALAQEEDLPTRLQLIRLLGKIRFEPARAVLQSQLESQDPKIVRAAAAALNGID